MDYPICRHIRTNGRQCRAAMMNGAVYCYFHQNLHRRHQGFRHSETTRGYLIPGQHVELAPLEDRDSVQMALSIVINALATGQLETKRATALLYGLQLASMNAARLRLESDDNPTVRILEPNPEGPDLAEPGATRSYETPEELLAGFDQAIAEYEDEMEEAE